MGYTEAIPAPTTISSEEPDMTCLQRRPPATRWMRTVMLLWLLVFFNGTLTRPQAQAAPVPDFTLQLLDGNTTSLQDHRGKPVLINFFHSK